MWPVKAKSSIKGENMKVCGHSEEIEGFWCFVENFRDRKIIHEKIPMEQHLQELAEAKKRLHDLVTMNCKDFIQRHSH